MHRIMLCLWLSAWPLFGFSQQISTPLQDERLDLSSCLLAIEQLPPTYRSHLSKACIEIPVKVCLVRGTALSCLNGVNQISLDFLKTNYPKLPKSISGTGFKVRGYERAVKRMGNEITEPDQTSTTVEQAQSIYSGHAANLIDLFYRARQSNVDLSK